MARTAKRPYCLPEWDALGCRVLKLPIGAVSRLTGLVEQAVRLEEESAAIHNRMRERAAGRRAA